VVLTACGAGSDPVGTGFLDVADVEPAARESHFTGPAERIQGRLALHPDGCVPVVVAGVERMPLWPEGTEVAQDPANLARYTVRLPGGLTLAVSTASGDAFTAEGVIDDSPAPFDGAVPPQSKVGSFLAFCGVKAAPVAFRDAATFTARPS
jgi:hypothetical protein